MQTEGQGFCHTCLSIFSGDLRAFLWFISWKMTPICVCVTTFKPSTPTLKTSAPQDHFSSHSRCFWPSQALSHPWLFLAVF